MAGYGFSVTGNQGNLVISDETPILTQAYKGTLVVNGLVGATLAYGYCHVTYDRPINSGPPPMVFGVPTGAANSAGLGLFCHRGDPGNWTGFSVMVVRDVRFQVATPMTEGFDSGWTWRACGFGIAGNNGYDPYGLRIWDKLGTIIYDSAWPVVKFLGLLSGWTPSGFTSGYAVAAYWEPNSNYDEHGIAYDQVLALGYHAWGSPDTTKGILISSLGLVNSDIDFGSDNKWVASVVFVGFNSGARDALQATAVFGKGQHPSGDLSNMQRWNLLAADFTGI